MVWAEIDPMQPNQTGPMCTVGAVEAPTTAWRFSGVSGILISPDLFLTCAHGGVTKLILFGILGVGVRFPAFPSTQVPAEILQGITPAGLSSVGVYFDYYHRGPPAEEQDGNLRHTGAAARSASIKELVEWGPEIDGLDYAIVRLRAVPQVNGQPRGFARMRGWTMTEGNDVMQFGFPSGTPMRFYSSRIDEEHEQCAVRDRAGNIIYDQHVSIALWGSYSSALKHDACMRAQLGSSSGVSGAAWLDDPNGCVRGVGIAGTGDAKTERRENIAVRLTNIMRVSPVIREELAKQAPWSGNAIPFHIRAEGDERYEHIFFRSSGGAGFDSSLMQLSRKAGVAWSLRDLTALGDSDGFNPPAPRIGATLCGWWNSEEQRTHVAYPSESGVLIHLSGSPRRLRISTWRAENFSRVLEVEQLDARACTAWRSSDDRAHLIVIGRERDRDERGRQGPNKVIEVWQGDGWSARDLGGRLGLPEPVQGGGLTSWYDSLGDDSHFAYVSTTGALVHVWHDGQRWMPYEEVPINNRRVTGRIASNYYGGSQRIVFRSGGHILQAFWRQGGWQIRDFTDELQLDAAREPDGELALTRDGPYVFFINTRARVVKVDLRREREVELPAPESPIPGVVVRVVHIGSQQLQTGFTLVGTGGDGQIYWWDDSEGQWRGYSLLARTGWPAGWKYDPQIGRIP
jgi:hypothetical protein